MNIKQRDKLGLYSVLGLAGGMTFGISAADADFIFTDIDAAATPGQPLGLDFNGDGTDEFVVDLRDDIGPNNYGTLSNWAGLFGQNGAEFVATDPSPFGGVSYGPNNLAFGELISAGDTFFGSGPLQLAYRSYLTNSNFGAFNDLSATGYVGVQFDLNGNNVFGWIEVEVIGDVTNNGFADAQVFVGRIAFDDSGAPVQAGVVVPEPSSLGLLALGAAGLAWRRRKNRKD